MTGAYDHGGAKLNEPARQRGRTSRAVGSDTGQKSHPCLGALLDGTFGAGGSARGLLDRVMDADWWIVTGLPCRWLKAADYGAPKIGVR